MLLTDEEIKVRIESPLNLLNRLRSVTTRNERSEIPSIPPTADQLIENLEEKINFKNSDTNNNARKLLNEAITQLSGKLQEVSKPEKLSTIARDMSAILANEGDNKKSDLATPQIIVYAPQIRDEREFVTINIREKEEKEK